MLSIKITIYRLANHSRIVDALCRACERGKQVTVVIELMARFDEENNMHFASKLQEAGCTIIYGMENYKVHSKIISIVLKEGEEIRYITHLGTGNYKRVHLQAVHRPQLHHGGHRDRRGRGRILPQYRDLQYRFPL